jgi:transposase
MPAKVYKVTLSDEEKSFLTSLTSKGKGAAQKLNHAYILLKADQSENGPGWDDQKISESFNVSVPTVERIRKTFVQEGLEAALHRQAPCRTRSLKFDGEKEAHLITLACSEPPDGHSRWTLRLLADKMVELNYFDELSYETVRQVLKKTNLNLGSKNNGASLLKLTPNSFVQWRIF